ncbi:MAG: xanthine dehydrogenase family protein [Treponema sp.]|nr:xanthine dehydrogenase family protein [Treponema sp.]
MPSAATKKTEEKKTIISLEAKGFYSDSTRPNLLYAALVRSPASSGKIKSVTISKLPEGYYFYTANDIPARKFMELNKIQAKIFGYDSIGYSGEPVGIIAGPDEEKVYELLEEVSVNLDIESLESALKNVIKKQHTPVIDLRKNSDVDNFVEAINDLPSLDTVVDKSLKEEDPNQTVATREIKTGVYKKKSEEEADKELFNKAAYISEETWNEQLTNPNWQETAGAFCYMEGEKLHIFAATKWTHALQKSVCEILDIDPQLVIIHKTKSSGFYPNGVWRTTQIACQAAVASYLSHKPVKLVLSSTEQFKYMAPGVDTEIKYKAAIDAEGKITTLKVNIDIDIGATNPFAQEITDRISIGAVNYYKIKNLCIKTNTHKSKNPPTSITLKNVDSQAFFAIENQIQKICHQTKLFPDEVRLINSKPLKHSDFPFDIQVTEIENTIASTIKSSDFNRKYASFHMEVIDRVEKDSKPFFALPLRGIGISSAYNGSGYLGDSNFRYDSKIEVTLTKDEKAIIHAIKPSEVIQDIWRSTVSELLSIPKQNVQIDSSFEYDQLPESPDDSLSTIGIVNELIKKCCTEIQKKRFRQALPITSKKTITPTAKKAFDKDTFKGNPFSSTSFASTAVEVELDPYTYNEKIKGVYITINCGELFDEAAALKTIRLEIQQELTMLVEGKTVQCDNISIQFIQSKDKAGQIGGLVHNTLPAAFSSALSLALATQLTQLPCTEAQLFELIKARRAESQIQKSEATEDVTAEQEEAK